MRYLLFFASVLAVVAFTFAGVLSGDTSTFFLNPPGKSFI